MQVSGGKVIAAKAGFTARTKLACERFRQARELLVLQLEGHPVNITNTNDIYVE